VEWSFTATALNRLWPTDTTGHHTEQVKASCCVIKHVYSDTGSQFGFTITQRTRARHGMVGSMGRA